MLEEQRMISTASAAAAVAAAEVPTSSAVLPSSSPLSNVAPPPPTAAAAATAPSSSAGNDSTPLQVAGEISECDGTTDRADDPHATASCLSDSDDGIADVDTAVAAASSSSPPQKQPSLSPSQRSRRITTSYHQDYSSDGTIPSPDHQQGSRMVEDCATSAEAAPSSQSLRDGSSRTTTSSSSSNSSSTSNTNATTITQGKTLSKTDCNIVLSMKDPTYKATMFSFFQKLGVKTSDKRNVERETQVKNEAYDFFKNSGGRLMTYINFRRPDEGVVEVDEKTARDKIFRDIAARMESSHHWRNAKENFANDIPSFQQEDSAEVKEEVEEEDSAEVEEEEEEEDESEEEESLSVSSDEEDTSDYEDGSTSSSLLLLPVLKKGKDVILSMRDANYKATMFSFFQKLGAKTSVQRDPDEEKKVKEEAYDFFKNSGGRLMIYRTKSVADGLMKADDKAAWSKISMDISRRLESSAHWAQWFVPEKQSAKTKVPVKGKASVKKMGSVKKKMSIDAKKKEAKRRTGTKKKTSSSSSSISHPPQQHDSTTDLSLVGYNNNEDIIMSMTDDRYKSNMYGFYQKLGVSANEEDEEKMKKEVFELFQSLNGRFVRYVNWRHPQLGVVELDDKEVKRRIAIDFFRRKDSTAHWKAPTQLTIVPPKKSSKKIVGIRKSSISSKKAKYSPPTKKRASPYPKRSKARAVTFEDEQPLVQRTTTVKRNRSSSRWYQYEEDNQLELCVETSLVPEEKASRDYKCSVCGLPKKGHKCQGYPALWEESFTVAPETPARARSKSRPSKTPKYITPARESDDFLPSSFPAVAKPSGQRARPCGECQNCLRKECGECANCLDMPKFGGPGVKRQRCLERRCINRQYPSTQATYSDHSQFTTSRSATKRKSAIAANMTIMTAMADDDDSESEVPLGAFFDSVALTESRRLVRRANIVSGEKDLHCSEDMSVSSDFDELVEMLDLPSISSSSEMDWQDLHLASLSPIPIIPTETRVVKLDTSRPIIIGPTNSAWSHNLVVTDEVPSPSRPGMPVHENFKCSLRSMPVLESDVDASVSPNSADRHASIFPVNHPGIKLYSPIRLLPRRREE